MGMPMLQTTLSMELPIGTFVEALSDFCGEHMVGAQAEAGNCDTDYNTKVHTVEPLFVHIEADPAEICQRSPGCNGGPLVLRMNFRFELAVGSLVSLLLAQ